MISLQPEKKQKQIKKQKAEEKAKEKNDGIHTAQNEKKKKERKEGQKKANKQKDQLGGVRARRGFKTRAPGLQLREGSGQQQRFQPASQQSRGKKGMQGRVQHTHPFAVK